MLPHVHKKHMIFS